MKTMPATGVRLRGGQRHPDAGRTATADEGEQRAPSAAQVEHPPPGCDPDLLGHVFVLAPLGLLQAHGEVAVVHGTAEIGKLPEAEPDDAVGQGVVELEIAAVGHRDQLIGVADDRAASVGDASLREGDQALAVLVPELQSHGAQAVPQGEGRHIAEDHVLVVGTLEVVVGNAGTEVVNVMEADVAGEELKDLGQLQVGAPAERRVGVGPAVGALPVGVLELMLHVEEPHAGRTGEPEDRRPARAGSHATRSASRVLRSGRRARCPWR